MKKTSSTAEQPPRWRRRGLPLIRLAGSGWCFGHRAVKTTWRLGSPVKPAIKISRATRPLALVPSKKSRKDPFRAPRVKWKRAKPV